MEDEFDLDAFFQSGESVAVEEPPEPRQRQEPQQDDLDAFFQPREAPVPAAERPRPVESSPPGSAWEKVDREIEASPPIKTFSPSPGVTVVDKSTDEQEKQVQKRSLAQYEKLSEGSIPERYGLDVARKTLPFGIADRVYNSRLADANRRYLAGEATDRDLDILGEDRARKSLESERNADVSVGGTLRKAADVATGLPLMATEFMAGGAAAKPIAAAANFYRGASPAGRALSGAAGQLAEIGGQAAAVTGGHAAVAKAFDQADAKEIASHAIDNTLFAALGPLMPSQGKNFILRTLKGTAKGTGAVEAASEVKYRAGLSEQGSTPTRLAQGDPTAIRDFGAQLLGFGGFEAAMHAIPAIRARYAREIKEGTPPESPKMAEAITEEAKTAEANFKSATEARDRGMAEAQRDREGRRKLPLPPKARTNEEAMFGLTEALKSDGQSVVGRVSDFVGGTGAVGKELSRQVGDVPVVVVDAWKKSGENKVVGTYTSELGEPMILLSRQDIAKFGPREVAAIVAHEAAHAAREKLGRPRSHDLPYESRPQEQSAMRATDEVLRRTRQGLLPLPKTEAEPTPAEQMPQRFAPDAANIERTLPILQESAREQGRTSEQARVQQGVEQRIEENQRVGAGPEIAYSGIPLNPEWAIAAERWMFSNRPSDKVPTVAIDLTNRLPRPQNYAEEKLIASDPSGIGKAGGIGKILDPRANAVEPVDKAIIARAFASYKGDSLAAKEVQTLATKYGDPFPVKDGTIALADGSKGFKADVIEAEMARPGSQSLTDVQRKWINEEWKPILANAREMLEAEGVRQYHDADGNPVGENYFPRPAVGKKDIAQPIQVGASQQRPGGKKSFMKERLYETEAEGAKAGIEYDPDVHSVVGKFISGVYRAIADHRLSKDESLGGKTPVERFEAMKAASEPTWKNLPKDTQQDMFDEMKSRSAHPAWQKETTVNVAPAFQGKIYPIEVGAKLSKAYGESSHEWVRKAEQVTAAYKAAKLVLDMSAPFVQGAPTMFSNPGRWAKATALSYKSLFDPKTLGKYLSKAENDKAASELIQSGENIGRLQDFMSGAEKGQLITKIPVLGPAIEKTGRAFGVFMDVAKIELWKAYSPTTPKEQWPKLSQAIGASLGTGRMESIGLHPGQALGERLMLLAPSYYRGAADLVATAFQKGVPGNVARRMLGSFATGVVATSVGGMIAAGLSWDEIQDRLNPAKGKFLKTPVTMPGGGKVEVGPGHVILSGARLVGDAYEYLTSNNPINTGAEGNPFLRYLRGKSAFLPKLGIELFTGKDYMGNRIGATEALVRSFEPIVVEQLLHGEGTQGQKIGDAVFSFFGATSYPQNVQQSYFNALGKAANEQFNKPYEKLSLREQAQVVKTLQKQGGFEKPPVTPAQIERAFAAQVERQKDLMAGVKEETRKRLGEFSKELPTYKHSLRAANVDIPMTREQSKRFRDLLVEEYDRSIAAWPLERMRTISADQRVKYMESNLEKAKERAKARLIKEFASGRDLFGPIR